MNGFFCIYKQMTYECMVFFLYILPDILNSYLQDGNKLALTWNVSVAVSKVNVRDKIT